MLIVWTRYNMCGRGQWRKGMLWPNLESTCRVIKNIHTALIYTKNKLQTLNLKNKIQNRANCSDFPVDYSFLNFLYKVMKIYNRQIGFE